MATETRSEETIRRELTTEREALLSALSDLRADLRAKRKAALALAVLGTAAVVAATICSRRRRRASR